MQNKFKNSLFIFIQFTLISIQTLAGVNPSRIFCENSIFENDVLVTLRSDVVADYQPQHLRFSTQEGKDLIDIQDIFITESNPLFAKIYFTARNSFGGKSLYVSQVDYTASRSQADEVARLPFLPPEGDDESGKYGLRNFQYTIGKYNGLTSIVYPKFKDTRNGNKEKPIYDYLYNPLFNSESSWLAFNWYDTKSKKVKGGITTPMNEKTIYLPNSQFQQNKLHFMNNERLVWFESGQPLSIMTATRNELEKSISHQIAALPTPRAAQTLIGFTDLQNNQWISYTDESNPSPVLKLAQLKSDNSLSEFKLISYPQALIDLIPSNKALGLQVLTDVKYDSRNQDLIYALGLNGSVAIFNLKNQEWRILGQLNSQYRCLKVSIGEEAE